MKKVILNGFLFAMVFLLIITGCNKEDDSIAINDNTPVTSDENPEADAICNADVNMMFSDVFDIADEAYISASGYKSSGYDDSYFIGGCATITLDTLSNPRMLTVDFGDENCLCNDGHYRRGKIIITFTGPYRMIGTVITHSFDNYYVDDNAVMGSMIVTNAGRDEYNNLNYLISSNAIIIRADSSGQFTRAGNFRRIWIEGENTPDRFDDIYLIKGKAYGQLASGSNYRMNIVNPLRREIGCKYFVSGVFKFKTVNKPEAIFNYGDGECDNIATVTINGITHTIYLP